MPDFSLFFKKADAPQPSYLESFAQKSLPYLDALRNTALKFPLSNTPEKRNTLRLAATAALATGGIGGATAISFALRRKNLKKLLDKEKAKSLLPLQTLQKQGGVTKKEARYKALKALAGLTALGSAGYGGSLYVSRPVDPAQQQTPQKPYTDKTDTRPAIDKVKEFATNLVTHEKKPVQSRNSFYNMVVTTPSYLYNLATTGKEPPPAKAEETQANPLGQWWSLPLITAAGLGSPYLAYKGVNAMITNQRRKKLERERDAAKQRFENALLSEQQSKLGAALDQYVTAFEKTAFMDFTQLGKPSSWPALYLGILGTASLLGGLGGFNGGMSNVDQSHRLKALEQLRTKQLAARREGDLNVLPQDVKMPLLLTHEDKNKDDDENADKFGGLYKWATPGISTMSKYAPKVAPLFSNISKGKVWGATDDFMKRMPNVGNSANTTNTVVKAPQVAQQVGVTLQHQPVSSKLIRAYSNPSKGSNNRTSFTDYSRPSATAQQTAAQPQPIPPGYGPGWADQKLLAFNNLIKNMATTTTAPVFSAARNNPKITNMLKYLTGLGTVGAATGVGINEIRGLYNNSP
ncbi:MAG: hypothetical protein LBI18_03675, partial [Planctomycetaceae bacterium]|nr:hypothetical protein [Planctomycetaceae bacterium]